MNKMMNLQDVFLNQARKEKILVTIILMNGFQFKGIGQLHCHPGMQRRTESGV